MCYWSPVYHKQQKPLSPRNTRTEKVQGPAGETGLTTGLNFPGFHNRTCVSSTGVHLERDLTRGCCPYWLSPDHTHLPGWPVVCRINALLLGREGKNLKRCDEQKR